MSDENFINYSPQPPKGTSVWVRNVGYLISVCVGGVLVSTDVVETIFGVDTLEDKIIEQDGQIDIITRSLSTVSESVGGLKEQIKSLEEERNDLKSQIKLLESRLESEVGSRKDLQKELEKKESRISELETLLARLTSSSNDVNFE